MSDRGIFVGMTGEKDAMFRLRMITNNLANVNTTGFRADYAIAQADSAQTDPRATRVGVEEQLTYSEFEPGPLIQTGRNLDIAIQGKGFIAVQTPDGREAYTRAGDLQVDESGLLKSAKGYHVLGTGGPIQIPAGLISINSRGEIASQGLGEHPKDIVAIDTIKLVDIPLKHLQKGSDGLFYASEGAQGEIGQVRVQPEALEGSNVNAVQSMTDLIDVSRKIEMHARLIKLMEDMASRGNQLLNLTE